MHRAGDARFALRTLARSPLLTTVSVATLDLGIEANAAVFTISFSPCELEIRTYVCANYVCRSNRMSSRKKLTLSVDEEIIERAHRYSQRHNTSISQLVSNYLARLAESEPERRYSPTVRRLIGILPGEVSLEEYHRHLEEKYSK